MRIIQFICGLLVPVIAGFAALAGEVDESGGHIKIEEPARIGNDELSDIYRKLLGRMTSGYALSNYPFASGYNKWQLYNTAPYLSATHGNRYINNYANGRAKQYGKLGNGEKLPAGSVLAKDSLTITAERKVFPGALFIMEKLPAGISASTGDWRYVMIMPDGSLFGDSQGEGAAEMKFCHDCHTIKAKNDFVFFVPKKYRRGGSP